MVPLSEPHLLLAPWGPPCPFPIGSPPPHPMPPRESSCLSPTGRPPGPLLCPTGTPRRSPVPRIPVSRAGLHGDSRRVRKPGGARAPGKGAPCRLRPCPRTAGPRDPPGRDPPGRGPAAPESPEQGGPGASGHRAAASGPRKAVRPYGHCHVNGRGLTPGAVWVGVGWPSKMHGARVIGELARPVPGTGHGGRERLGHAPPAGAVRGPRR